MTKGKRRSFTAEFKAQVVLEVISGVKKIFGSMSALSTERTNVESLEARVCPECGAGF